MARTGPIVVIDDDRDDQELLEDLFKSIAVPNERIYFSSCEEAYYYISITKDKSYIIFSDMDLPVMSGGELKKKINESVTIWRNSIPFIFLTTSSAHHSVLEAYENLAQGFFIKRVNFQALKQMVEIILNYWKICQHPDPELL